MRDILKYISKYRKRFKSEDPKPSAWCTKEKSKSITVSACGTQAIQRDHIDDSQISSIRSNYPIPKNSGLFYFEVMIHEKGIKGVNLGIGLCKNPTEYNKMPGWDKDSIGYHSDDGNFFVGNGAGLSYGPRFTEGDVIGCCINLMEMTILYTKNGVPLNVMTSSFLKDSGLYPFIGMKSPGLEIEVNFGEKGFLFNYLEYKDIHKNLITNEILFSPVEENLDEKAYQLIVSWLVSEGFIDTLRSLPMCEFDSLDLVSIEKRKEILLLFREKKTDDAISLVETYYPSVLENAQVRLLRSAGKYLKSIIFRDFKSTVEIGRAELEPLYMQNQMNGNGKSQMLEFIELLFDLSLETDESFLIGMTEKANERLADSINELILVEVGSITQKNFLNIIAQTVLVNLELSEIDKSVALLME